MGTYPVVAVARDTHVPGDGRDRPVTVVRRTLDYS